MSEQPKGSAMSNQDPFGVDHWTVSKAEPNYRSNSKERTKQYARTNTAVSFIPVGGGVIAPVHSATSARDGRKVAVVARTEGRATAEGLGGGLAGAGVGAAATRNAKGAFVGGVGGAIAGGTHGRYKAGKNAGKRGDLKKSLDSHSAFLGDDIAKAWSMPKLPGAGGGKHAANPLQTAQTPGTGSRMAPRPGLIAQMRGSGLPGGSRRASMSQRLSAPGGGKRVAGRNPVTPGTPKTPGTNSVTRGMAGARRAPGPAQTGPSATPGGARKGTGRVRGAYDKVANAAMERPGAAMAIGGGAIGGGIGVGAYQMGQGNQKKNMMRGIQKNHDLFLQDEVAKAAAPKAPRKNPITRMVDAAGGKATVTNYKGANNADVIETTRSGGFIFKPKSEQMIYNGKPGQRARAVRGGGLTREGKVVTVAGLGGGGALLVADQRQHNKKIKKSAFDIEHVAKAEPRKAKWNERTDFNPKADKKDKRAYAAMTGTSTLAAGVGGYKLGSAADDARMAAGLKGKEMGYGKGIKAGAKTKKGKVGVGLAAGGLGGSLVANKYARETGYIVPQKKG